MKKRRVKKSVIKFTKALLAIMMIFTTFTNLPTLVEAIDQDNQTQEVQETPTETPVVSEEIVPQEPVEQPVADQPVVDETVVEESVVSSTTPEVVEEPTPTVVEETKETTTDKTEDIIEVVEEPKEDDSITANNDETIEEPVKVSDTLSYDLGFESETVIDPTEGFVGDMAKVAEMTLTREGYNFLYWYVLNEDGTETVYNPNDDYVLTEAEDKLIAKWEEVASEEVENDLETTIYSYVIKYMLADGTVVALENKESEETNVKVTALEEILDEQGNAYILVEGEAAEKEANLLENKEIIFKVIAKPVDETTQVETPKVLMMSVLNDSYYGEITVNVDKDVPDDTSKTINFEGGVINVDTAPIIEGYTFVKAYVTIASVRYDIQYAFTYNNTPYYSTDGDTAMPLEDKETITFYYEKNVTRYNITYKVTGASNVEGNSYSGLTSVKAGDSLSFNVQTAIGYKATVTVDGTTLTGNPENDGLTTIYIIDNINKDTEITINFSEQTTFNIDLGWKGSDNGRTHLHGASFNSNPPSTFKSGDTVTWTIESSYEDKVTWQLNSLRINGENINIPTDFSKEGASAETTLKNGKNAGIKVVVKLNSIERDWDLLGVKYYYIYTHEIKITGAKTDLVLEYANLRASDHGEVMPESLEGIELQYQSTDGKWFKMDTAVPIGQDEINTIQKGSWPWDTYYLQFRYKVKDGYEVDRIASNKEINELQEKDGYICFEIQKEPETLITLSSIGASLVQYKVVYDLVGGTAGPSDAENYNIVDKPTILIENIIPTKENNTFVGWELSGTGNIYWPGNTININDLELNEIAPDGDIKLVAQWSENPQEGQTVGYNILYQVKTPDGKDHETLKIEYKTGINGKTVIKTGNIDVYINTNGGRLVLDRQDSTLEGTIEANQNVIILTYERPYKVTYDLNGGIGDISDSNKYTKGDTVTINSTVVPTRLGYIFDGWLIKDDQKINGNEFIFPDNNDVTLVAQWIKDENQWHTVTFDVGENGTSEDTLVFDNILDETNFDEAVDVPEVTGKSGYVFIGWDNEFPEKVTTDLTYTAVYGEDNNNDNIPDEYEVKVHFTATNGTFNDGTREKTIVGGLKDAEGNWDKGGSYVLQADDIPQTGTADKGYTNGSWDTEPTAGTAITKETTYTYNYAKDENQWHTVTFDVGENGTSEDTLVFDNILDETNFDEAVDVPEVTGKSGYVFIGWDNEFPEKVTTDLTYTAQYAEDTNNDGKADDEQKLTIVFDAGEGSFDEDKQKTYVLLPGDSYPTDPSASLNAPEGKAFDNWDTEYALTGKVPADQLTETKTFTAIYGEDKNDDNVPDSKQAIVTYNVVNGTLDFNTVYVTLDANGVGYLAADQIPTATPNAGYHNGIWDVTPTDGMEITKNITFTITFSAIPSEPGTDPGNPDEPVFTCPDGTVWNDATGMCEAVNPVVPPVVDVDDDDVSPVDEVVDDVDEDVVDDEEVVINDDDMPQTGGDEEVVIDEEDTPEVGGSGSWALINLIASGLGVVMTIILLLSKHTKSDDDANYTRSRTWKVVGSISAIASVVVFFLTENIGANMVLVDSWTLLMIAFFLVNVVSLFMGRRLHEDNASEE